MKLSQLKGDPKARQEGRWVNWIFGTRLRIASADNPHYRQHRDRLLRPYRARLGSMTSAEIAAITAPAVAKHLLLDWEGFEAEDGGPLEYTAEMAVELLTNEDWNHLLDFINTTANDEAAYLKAGLEDTAGN